MRFVYYYPQPSGSAAKRESQKQLHSTYVTSTKNFVENAYVTGRNKLCKRVKSLYKKTKNIFRYLLYFHIFIYFHFIQQTHFSYHFHNKISFFDASKVKKLFLEAPEDICAAQKPHLHLQMNPYNEQEDLFYNTNEAYACDNHQFFHPARDPGWDEDMDNCLEYYGTPAQHRSNAMCLIAKLCDVEMMTMIADAPYMYHWQIEEKEYPDKLIELFEKLEKCTALWFKSPFVFNSCWGASSIGLRIGGEFTAEEQIHFRLCLIASQMWKYSTGVLYVPIEKNFGKANFLFKYPSIGLFRSRWLGYTDDYGDISDGPVMFPVSTIVLGGLDICEPSVLRSDQVAQWATIDDIDWLPNLYPWACKGHPLFYGSDASTIQDDFDEDNLDDIEEDEGEDSDEDPEPGLFDDLMFLLEDDPTPCIADMVEAGKKEQTSSHIRLQSAKAEVPTIKNILSSFNKAQQMFFETYLYMFSLDTLVADVLGIVSLLAEMASRKKNTLNLKLSLAAQLWSFFRRIVASLTKNTGIDVSTMCSEVGDISLIEHQSFQVPSLETYEKSIAALRKVVLGIARFVDIGTFGAVYKGLDWFFDHLLGKQQMTLDKLMGALSKAKQWGEGMELKDLGDPQNLVIRIQEIMDEIEKEPDHKWHLHPLVGELKEKMKVYRKFTKYLSSPLSQRYISMYRVITKQRLARKMEPVGISLLGPSGTGKTTATATICALLHGMLFSDERWQEDSIYYRTPGLEYWESYGEQKFVVFDDAEQLTAVDQRTQYMKEIFNIMSGTSAELNMAAVDFKGQKTFKSPFVFITNNKQDRVNQSGVIAEVDAYKRRFPLVLQFDKRIPSADKNARIQEMAYTSPSGVKRTIQEPRLCDIAYVIAQLYTRKLHTFEQYQDSMKDIAENTPQYREGDVDLFTSDLEYVASRLHHQAGGKDEQGTSETRGEELRALFSEGVPYEVEEQPSISTDSESDDGVYSQDYAVGGRCPYNRCEGSCCCFAYQCDSVGTYRYVAQGQYMEKIPADIRREVAMLAANQVYGPVNQIYLPTSVYKRFRIRLHLRWFNLKNWFRDKKVRFFHKYDNLKWWATLPTRIEDFVARYTLAITVISLIVVLSVAAYYILKLRYPHLKLQSGNPSKAHNIKVSQIRTVKLDQLHLQSNPSVRQIEKNIAIIRREDSSVVGSCFFVEDRQGLMPRHYLEEIGSQPLLFDRGGQMFTIQPHEIVYVTGEDDESDLCLFYFLTKKPPAVANVANKLISAKDLAGVTNVNAYSVVKRREPLSTSYETSRTIATFRPGKAFTTGLHDMTMNTFETQSSFSDGDCGSPLVAANHVQRPIMGFYSGLLSDLRSGVFQIVTIEQYYQLLNGIVYPEGKGPLEQHMAKRKGIQNIVSIPLDDQVPEDFPLPNLGRAPPGHRAYIQNVSAIKKSPLYGLIGDPVKTIPHLKPFQNPQGETVKPLYLALSKIKVDKCQQFEQSITVKSLASMVKEYLPFELGSGIPKTWTEVLSANPNKQFVRAFDCNTSSGYPWVIKGQKKKVFMTPKDDGIVELTPAGVEEVEKLEQGIQSGCVYNMIFLDCLKDETLPVEKVKEGKVRIFNVLPFTLNVLIRKYFGSYCNALMERSRECTVGINPHSRSWRHIRKEMEHEIIYTGDYSAYDKRLPFEACMSMLKLIEDYYKQLDDYEEWHSVMRENIFQLLFQSYRMAGNVLYTVDHGMPSGCAVTVILNSMVNSFLLRYAFFQLNPDVPISTFDEHVKLYVYGDDNVINVSSEIKKTYSLKKISKVMLQFGLVLKTGDKGEGFDPVERDDMVFLCRHFRFQNSWCYAPLPLHTIIESLYWMKDIESMSSTVTNALLELSHHPADVWDKYRNLIISRCRAEGIPTPTFSQEEAHAKLQKLTGSALGHFYVSI